MPTAFNFWTVVRSEPQTGWWVGLLKPRDWVCNGSFPLSLLWIALSSPTDLCLWEYPELGQDDLNRLVLVVIPVNCRRGVDTSSFSQGCTGCTHWEAWICFIVMLLKGPVITTLSPRQKPTQEKLLQHLSSTWLPGTPLLPLEVRGDKKTNTKISLSWHFNLSAQSAALGQGFCPGSNWLDVLVLCPVRQSYNCRDF